MFKRVYVEITNVCNLACSFCPGTWRERRFMTAEEFSRIAARLRGHTRFLYFHLMGEPLLHPELGKLLRIAGENGFRAEITTNGTLLANAGETLLSAGCLHRVNISLQSFEANAGLGGLEGYIASCSGFAQRCAESGRLCYFRLWNGGGDNERNGEILALLEGRFPRPWRPGQRNETLRENVFLEHGERFDWPGPGAVDRGERVFCRGLRDHIGVLCDGTVVPCCLDGEGAMPLGNLHEAELGSILASPRARAIYDGFTARRASEELCRRCGYARRF